MSKRMAAWFAWFMFMLSAGLFIGGALLLALTPTELWTRRPFFWPVDTGDLSFLAYVAVGALIAARRPRNAIGWLFCAIGLTWQVFGFAKAFASYLFLTAPASLNMKDLFLVLAFNMWFVAFGLAPFLLLLFPDGRLLSPRWRLITWVLGAAIVLGLVDVNTMFRAGSTTLTFPSPLGVLGIGGGTGLVEIVKGAGQIISLVAFPLGGIALILRLRRARGEERQQLKWFVYAGMFLSFIVVTTGVFFDWLHPLDPEALYEADLLYGIPWAVGLVAVPIGAGIAILKYRLYDIDIIIRRTLIYSVLTASLAIVYFGSVVLLQQLFRALTGQSSELAIIVSTLAIAALFVPLRQRVQNIIDRRFYRRKYDAQKVLAEFAATARDEVDLQRLTEGLLDVVDETMQPAHVSLWLKNSNAETQRRKGAKE